MKNTITAKLVMALLATMTFIIVISGIVLYLFKTHEYEREVSEQANRVGEEFSQSVADAVWNLSEPAIKNIINLRMQDKNIKAVIIKRADHSFHLGKTRDSGWNVINFSADPPDGLSGNIKTENEIVMHGRVIGHSEIIFTDSFLKRKFHNEMFLLMLIAAIFLSAVTAVIFALVKGMVINPILVLQNLVEDFHRKNILADSGGVLQPVPDIGGDDEIKNLESRFAAMREAILKTIGDLNEQIAERREAEAALRTSENLFRRYFELGLIGMAKTSVNHRWLHANEYLCNLLGYSEKEMKGKTWSEMTHHEDLQAELALFNRVLSGRSKEYSMEKRFITGGDETVHVKIGVRCLRNADGTPDCFIGMIEDVTTMVLAAGEKERLEEQLMHARKMEALARLAGGIAHDFNNMLGIILLSAETALYDVSDSSQVRQGLEKIIKTSEHSKEVIKQILAFTKKSAGGRRPLDFKAVVEEAATMIRAAMPSAIEMRLDIGAEGALILADPTQIHQVMINLCTNARQSMEEKGGVLEISLKRATPDMAISEDYGLKTGDWLELSVKDTGIGMEPETVRHIFDPYFTTKHPDKGGWAFQWCMES